MLTVVSYSEKASKGAKLVYTGNGIFITFAKFPYTQSEANAWVRYPSEYKRAFEIAVIPMDSEETACEYLEFLNA